MSGGWDNYRGREGVGKQEIPSGERKHLQRGVISAGFKLILLIKNSESGYNFRARRKKG